MEIEEFQERKPEECKSVTPQSETMENEKLLGSIDWQWCDYYGDYVGVKPINMAVKRMRTDEDGEGDHEMEEKEEDKPLGKAGKGGKGVKGKGKRGPATGCYECKGDHYASECPNLRFSKNQWKGIRPPLYPESAWSRMYEPIQQSWKGKGKGKSYAGGFQYKGGHKGKGQGKGKGQMGALTTSDWLDFPPLNALNVQQEPSWNDQSSWWGQGYLMCLNKSVQKTPEMQPPRTAKAGTETAEIQSRAGVIKHKKKYICAPDFNKCVHQAKSFCCRNRFKELETHEEKKPKVYAP